MNKRGMKNGTGNKCVNKNDAVRNTVKRVSRNNIVAIALALVFPSSAYNGNARHPVKEITKRIYRLSDNPVHQRILAKVSAYGSLRIKTVPHAPVWQHFIHYPNTQCKHGCGKKQQKYAPAGKLQNIEANQL